MENMRSGISGTSAWIKREDTTTDSAVIKMTIGKYYEQLNANKFNNLNEMEKFLDTNYLSSCKKQ